MSEALKRWRRIAERLFPADARVIELPRRNVNDREGWQLLVSWRLQTDPKRPSRRSKSVRIEVTAEALEDYVQSVAGAQQAADTRFARWIERELAAFDPDHDAPLGREPPVVPWTLGTVELNG